MLIRGGQSCILSDTPPCCREGNTFICSLASGPTVPFFSDICLGPGGSVIVVAGGHPLPVYFSKFCQPDWPPPDLMTILTAPGFEPIERIECSTVNHEYFWVVRFDGETRKYRYDYHLPFEAHERVARWRQGVNHSSFTPLTLLPSFACGDPE